MELDNFQPEIRVQLRCSPRLWNSKIHRESLRRRAARSLPGARLVCSPPGEQRAFSGPALGSGGESTCPGTGKAPQRLGSRARLLRVTMPRPLSRGKTEPGKRPAGTDRGGGTPRRWPAGHFRPRCGHDRRKSGHGSPTPAPSPKTQLKKKKRTAPDLERCQLADNLESPFYELSKMRGEWPREFSSSRLYHATNNRLDTRSTLLKPLWLFCSTPRLRGKLGPRASGYTKHKLECDVKIIIMKRRHVILHNLQRLCGFH